jgi:hypothetical protein
MLMSITRRGAKKIARALLPKRIILVCGRAKVNFGHADVLSSNATRHTAMRAEQPDGNIN